MASLFLKAVQISQKIGIVPKVVAKLKAQQYIWLRLGGDKMKTPSPKANPYLSGLPTIFGTLRKD